MQSSDCSKCSLPNLFLSAQTIRLPSSVWQELLLQQFIELVFQILFLFSKVLPRPFLRRSAQSISAFSHKAPLCSARLRPRYQVLTMSSLSRPPQTRRLVSLPVRAKFSWPHRQPRFYAPRRG